MTRMGTRKPRAGAWICHRVSGIRRGCPIGRHRYRTRRRTCPSGEDDVARLALGMGSPFRGARKQSRAGGCADPRQRSRVPRDSTRLPDPAMPAGEEGESAIGGPEGRPPATSPSDVDSGYRH